MRALLILMLLAVMALSGCTSTTLPPYADDCAPPVGARIVDVQAVAPEFDLPVEVTVVSAQTGEPLAGANVVVQWARPNEGAGPRAARDLVQYVALATDMDGRVEASVPDDVYVIVAAALPGYTEEWSPLMEPGAINDTVEIPLYPDVVTSTFEATFSGIKTAADPLQERWLSQSMFAQLDATMLSRAHQLTVVMKWQQAQSDGIDIDAAIGPHPGDANLTYGALASHSVAGGDPPYMEAVFSGRNIHYWPDLYVGPYAEHGHALQSPVTVNVTAHLDLARGDRVVRECILYADSVREQIESSSEPVATADSQAPVVAISLSGIGGIVLGAVVTALLKKR